LAREVPRFRILVEGAVIVVSILLALTADAWWESVTERRLERDALERLSVELAEIDDVLVEWQGYHQTVSAATTELLRHTGPRTVSTLPADSIARLIWTGMIVWTVDPPTATIASLETSGRLGLIRSQEVLTQLASWRSLLADHQGDEQTVLSYTYGAIQPYLVSRLGWRNVSFHSGDDLYVGTASRFPDDLDAVLGDREFEGHMDMRRTETANLLANYDVLRARLSDLSVAVDAELDR
jgi:type II secretory pathway pseudopilin PulG